MIIARSPLRISLGGGGTDLPSYYEDHAGFLIAAAIDKYVYITLHQTFVPELIIKYSKLERVESLDAIEHPIIREALKLVGIPPRGLEITSMADIPAGTGLGSSGSFTTALLKVLHAQKKNLVHPSDLAEQACEIELNRLKEPIGKQDQYIAAYGGLKYTRFNPDGSVFTDPIICSPTTLQQLQDGLLLLYTGLTRKADNILVEQAQGTRTEEAKQASLRHMVGLADQLYEALGRDDLDAFGEVLHCGWVEKRKLASGISNNHIDDWYERARANGAIGGKLLGAGGGGFLLFYAPPERHADICKALPELRHVPFYFSPQGSKVVYVEENGYEPS